MLRIHHRPFERYILKDKGLKHRCVILLGQRGIGKTTTLIQHLLHHDATGKKVLYVPCDHILLGKQTLYEVSEHFSRLGGEMIAFDEIHKYAAWAKELKSIFDTFPSLKILASGSSALEIHKASHDLSRRAIELKLHGMSFREFINLRLNLSLEAKTLEQLLAGYEDIAPSIIKEIEAKDAKVLALFKEYLDCGFYPYFLEFEDKETFWQTLEQNLRATIESDLPAIYSTINGATIKKLKDLLFFIANSVPFTPKWSAIQSILGIKDSRTLKTYFKYLEDVFLIKTISSASQKMSRIEKSEKVYLNNSNQIQAIANGQGNIGNIRETYFLNMLSLNHRVKTASTGDFMVDEAYTFEIGGKNKDFGQVKDVMSGYVVSDDIEIGFNRKIPLWLFGFLY